MDVSARRNSHGDRLGVTSASVGAIGWLAVPYLPAGTPPSFLSLEHVFLFLPLVAAPLALALLASLWRAEGGETLRLHAIAQRTQPAAAALVLASFCLAKGAAAGALAAAWVAMAVTVAVGGVVSVRSRGGVRLSNVSLLAAQVFLAVGAVFLLLSRVGTGPRGMSAPDLFLGALHLHFSGFAAQILIGATGRRLRGSASWLGAVHRCVVVGAIAAVPLITVGKALSVPALRLVGVGSIALGLTGLALTSTVVAIRARSPVAMGLLLASAMSIAAGMALAGVYGVGEFTGRDWIGIPRMVTTHGLLVSLGFVLCGLSAHLLLERSEAESRARAETGPLEVLVG